MAKNGQLTKRSEKGLLTPDNCVVAFVDLQPQMLFGVNGADRQTIINSNLILAKAARVFGLPLVVSTVETKSFSGYMWPQLKAVVPDEPVIERTTMNSWDDANFVAAIKKTGKKKIVLAGLWTETCVALLTVQAIFDGYEVFIVEDACGDVSALSHANAMQRCIQAGAKPVTALSVMLEWQRDWAHEETYFAVMDILKSHAGSYGQQVEYASTMVLGREPAVFAPFTVAEAPPALSAAG
jgi:nicotinamidase-related amidase